MLLSFLVDIPIFLPLLGALLLWLAVRGGRNFAVAWGLAGFVTLVTGGGCLWTRQWALLGILLAALVAAIVTARRTRRFLLTFVPFTLAIFWIVSGGLYYDCWGEGGNHFMWYSWLDRMGIVESRPIPTPTYQDPYGFWNLLGLLLFLCYPVVLLGLGRCYLKGLRVTGGILFGRVKGQSGLWGLLTNR